VTVIWCNPPRYRTPWAALLEECMTRPRVWALVRDDFQTKEQAQYAVSCLRRGVKGGRKGYKVPPGRWEFSTAQIVDRGIRYGLWARWLGE
jgi:hypothetical protein